MPNELFYFLFVQLHFTIGEKNILIIGGGPAGMEAAIEATQLGHHVEIWEKTTRLGGLINAAGRPAFKKEVADLVNYFNRQIIKLGIKVRYCHEATADEIISYGADKVIIATGSTPLVPASIPGIHNHNVVTAVDFLEDKALIGHNVALIGGGLVGAETAVHLTNLGRKVSLIEMNDEILAEDMFYQNKHMLKSIIFEDENIEVFEKTKLKEINEDNVVVEKDGNTFSISCDTVILAMGLRSNNKLYNELNGKVSLEIIGSTKEPRRILEATAEAREAILNINNN